MPNKKKAIKIGLLFIELFLFSAMEINFNSKMSQFIIYLSCFLAIVCQVKCATKTACTNERIQLRLDLEAVSGDLVSSTSLAEVFQHMDFRLTFTVTIDVYSDNRFAMKTKFLNLKMLHMIHVI